jgi:hypothetical protein
VEVIIYRGADKILAFLFAIFLFAAQPKDFFLGWVKEVRTTKSCVSGAHGGICRVNTVYFFNPVGCCLLYKAKDLSAPLIQSYHHLRLQSFFIHKNDHSGD